MSIGPYLVYRSIYGNPLDPQSHTGWWLDCLSQTLLASNGWLNAIGYAFQSQYIRRCSRANENSFVPSDLRISSRSSSERSSLRHSLQHEGPPSNLQSDQTVRASVINAASASLLNDVLGQEDLPEEEDGAPLPERALASYAMAGRNDLMARVLRNAMDSGILTSRDV